MWLDHVSTKIANWIVRDAVPAVKAFFQEYFSNTIFHSMTPEELQIFFLKIAIQAVILIIILGIRPGRKKKSRKQPNRNIRTNRNQPTQKWSPTGWYWDDKKQSWIPPDYLSEESKKRWKWDPEKKIWIDQEKDSTK